MSRFIYSWSAFVLLLAVSSCLLEQPTVSAQRSGTAEQPFTAQYEQKPDAEVFAKFFPRKAPPPGTMMLRHGDRLAIVGDSITQQKMYSAIIETYLHTAYPSLDISVRQYGWSGEKTDGFLRRMDQDCLRFSPTIATISYGMNDGRYRPFDVNNGNWYRHHYTGIVRKFKAAGTRVVVGSPGCAGKIASWVKSRSGTLDEYNLNLCALRDIAIGVAESEGVQFADVFWPMFQSQHFAAAKYGTSDHPYEVAGSDGVHPGWAGHVLMAYVYLRSLGIDGHIGTINVSLSATTATTTDGHTINSVTDDDNTTVVMLTSDRIPFCSTGPLDRDDSIRSGMTLVPFARDLNRFMLVVPDAGNTNQQYSVTWGDETRVYSAEQLVAGINLADEFNVNPFSDVFHRVASAVDVKQAFETEQIKKMFHGKPGREDFEGTVRRTELHRSSLVDKIDTAMIPVTHTVKITAK